MGQDTVLRRTGDELAHYQCRLVRVCRCGRAGCVSCVLSSCDGLFLCLFVQRWWYRGGPGRLWDGRVSAKRNSSVIRGLRRGLEPSSVGGAFFFLEAACAGGLSAIHSEVSSRLKAMLRTMIPCSHRGAWSPTDSELTNSVKEMHGI